MTALETERLTLRKPRIEDAESIFEVKNDSNVKNFYFELNHHDSSVEDLRRFISHSMTSFEANGFNNIDEAIFPVILRSANIIIGAVCINTNNHLSQVTLGCIIKGEYSHCGYGTEALNAFSDFVFYSLKPQAIAALVSPTNTAALNFAEKCGFQIIEKRSVYDACRRIFSDEYIYLRKLNPDSSFGKKSDCGN